MTLLHRHRSPLSLPGAGLRSRGRSRTGTTGPVPVVVPVRRYPAQPPAPRTAEEHRPPRTAPEQRTVPLPVRPRGLTLRDLGELYDR